MAVVAPDALLVWVGGCGVRTGDDDGVLFLTAGVGCNDGSDELVVVVFPTGRSGRAVGVDVGFVLFAGVELGAVVLLGDDVVRLDDGDDVGARLWTRTGHT